MKRSLLITFFVISVSNVAFAQAPGSVGVFADANAIGCDIQDNGGLIKVYLVHVFTDGATASQFMLDVSATNWMHLGDLIQFQVVIGISISGISIAYGACMLGPVYLGNVNFFGSNEPPCTYIGIVPDPGAPTGKIEGVDCYETKFFPTGGQLIVNPTVACGCYVSVEETTWGQVKALYQ